LSMTARLLVPAASLGVAPSSGDLAAVLAALRQAIGELRAKLRGGAARGGVVRGEEAIGVENEGRGALYL
jgi:hypothetical protein